MISRWFRRARARSADRSWNDPVHWVELALKSLDTFSYQRLRQEIQQADPRFTVVVDPSPAIIEGAVQVLIRCGDLKRARGLMRSHQLPMGIETTRELAVHCVENDDARQLLKLLAQGGDRFEVSDAIGKLASRRATSGDLRGALDLVDRIIDVGARVLPPESRSGLFAWDGGNTVLHAIVGALAENGDVARALRVCKELEGSWDHSEIQRCKHTIASSAAACGRIGDLRQVLEEVRVDLHADLMLEAGLAACTHGAIGDARACLKRAEALTDDPGPDETSPPGPASRMRSRRFLTLRAALGDLDVVMESAVAPHPADEAFNNLIEVVEFLFRHDRLEHARDCYVQALRLLPTGELLPISDERISRLLQLQNLHKDSALHLCELLVGHLDPASRVAAWEIALAGVEARTVSASTLDRLRQDVEEVERDAVSHVSALAALANAQYASADPSEASTTLDEAWRRALDIPDAMTKAVSLRGLVRTKASWGECQRALESCRQISDAAPGFHRSHALSEVGIAVFHSEGHTRALSALQAITRPEVQAAGFLKVAKVLLATDT